MVYLTKLYMHKRLRDLAKVGVGLVIADLIGVLWFSAAGFFPLAILGVTWTSQAILPIALFDIALIIVLVHAGWHTKAPVRSPSERTLLRLVGAIFLLVAIVHLLRLAFGWNVVLGDFDVPVWVSWLGVFFAGYLAFSSFHLAARKGK